MTVEEALEWADKAYPAHQYDRNAVKTLAAEVRRFREEKKTHFLNDPVLAAALCAKLKEECEKQYERAEAAEAKCAAIQAVVDAARELKWNQPKDIRLTAIMHILDALAALEEVE